MSPRSETNDDSCYMKFSHFQQACYTCNGNLPFRRMWEVCWVFPWRFRYFSGFRRSWSGSPGRIGTWARLHGPNPKEIALLGHATFYSNTISKHLNVLISLALKVKNKKGKGITGKVGENRKNKIRWHSCPNPRASL